MTQSHRIARVSGALRGAWGAGLALAALSVLFLGSFAWPSPGAFLGGDDMIDQWVQLIRLAQSEVLQGRLPGWNPYLSGGLPLLANPQLGLFYPPYWLLWLGSIERAVSWIVGLHIFWMAFGTFMLGRRQNLSWLGAFCAALVMGFSGFVVVRASEGHPGFMASVSWMPWMLWAYVRSAQVRTAGSGVWLGLTFAGAALAGNPAGGMLAVFGLAVRVGLDLIQPPNGSSRAALLRPFVVAVPVAIGLAAIQLLPTIEYLSLSARSQTTYDFASQYSLPVAHLISLILPTFFGQPVRLGYWGEFPYMEYMYYPGVVTLTLIALVFLRRRAPAQWLIWLAFGGLGLVLSLGPAGGLHWLLYQVFLPIRYIRVPARFLSFTLLALAWLCGAAVDAWSAEPEFRVDWRPVVAALGAVGVLAVIADLVFTLQSGDDARAYHIGSALLRAGLLVGLTGAVLASPARRRPWLAGCLVTGLLIADLWGYGVQTLRFTPLNADRAWALAEATIADDTPYPERVLPWGLKLEQQNRGQDVGLASANAYDPLVLERSRRFFDSVADPRATTFDLLSTAWLLSPTDGAWLADDAFTAQATADGFGVYPRANALPRAWVAATARNVPDLDGALAVIHGGGFDGRVLALLERAECAAGTGGDARIMAYDPTHVTLTARGSGLLVLSEAWYPGWTATVDGQPAPVLIADGMLRGVCLTGGAGERVVRFEFQPTWFYVGAGVSAVTIAVGLWQIGLAFLRRRTRAATHS